MVFGSCCGVSKSRFFGDSKLAEMHALALDAYLRNPSPIPGSPINTPDAGFARFLNNLVLSVLRVANFAQIANPVVGFVSVDVVQDPVWEAPIYVKPCKPMSPDSQFVYFDDAVALLHPSGNIACKGLTIACGYAPPEDSGLVVVMKKFAQTLRCKIGLSHDAVLSLIGQRPASADNASGLRYFKG